MTEATPLVSDAELKSICSELDSTAVTTLFISSAHSIIWEYFGTSRKYTAARLKLIELYLAAHFAAITNPVSSFEGVGKVQQSVQYKVGLGLQFTKYGQQAQMLSGGTLLGKKISITWLGTIPSDTETVYATN
jgi:hypothetical protein